MCQLTGSVTYGLSFISRLTARTCSSRLTFRTPSMKAFHSVALQAVPVQAFSSESKRRRASRHFGNMLRLVECSSLVPKIESGGVFEAADAVGAKALA